MTYRDRHDAGRLLAQRLAGRAWHRPVVLALPRGGVPVAYEVAVALDAPLEVLVARKIGAPRQPELGIGAIAEGGQPQLDADSLEQLGLDERDLEDIVARERAELGRRIRHYRGERPLPELADRDVLVVDDGLATGVTARAALRALRSHAPRRLVLAVPISSPRSAAELEGDADEVVCLKAPRSFMAVGQAYDDFSQTTDETVVALLGLARARAPGSLRDR